MARVFKWWPFKVIQGRWFWHQSKAHIWDFLLVFNSNLGPILPRFRDSLLQLFNTESHFFLYSTPIPAKISGCSLLNTSMLFESSQSEYPRLTDREIILEVYQPLWSRYLNLKDRRLAVAIQRSV